MHLTTTNPSLTKNRTCNRIRNFTTHQILITISKSKPLTFNYCFNDSVKKSLKEKYKSTNQTLNNKGAPKVSKSPE